MEFPFGVERPLFFKNLIAAVTVVTVVLTKLVLIFVRVERKPVAGAVDDVGYLGVLDGFAEVVVGLNRGADGVALQDAGLGRLDFDFVFGLLVLLDVEPAFQRILAGADVDRVVAQRRRLAERELSLNRSDAGEVDRFTEDRLRFRVLDFDLDGFHFRQAVSGAHLGAQNALEPDLMAGPVDGTVRVDVTHPVFVWIAVQVPGIEGIDGEVVGGADHHHGVFRFGLFETYLGQPVSVGLDPGDFFPAGE